MGGREGWKVHHAYWGTTMTPDQRARTKLAMQQLTGHKRQRDGIRVFLSPTTGVPRVIEVRRYGLQGQVLGTIRVDATP